MTLTASDTMIPEEKQAVVERALKKAFGVKEYDDIRLLTGGLSTAAVYRIVVQGNPYLLRLTMRTDAAFDPTRQFACMELAAQAGIAPRIWYKSIEDRVLISDFVEPKPLPEDMASLMPSVLRTLHSLPGFPKGMYNYLDAMDGFVKQFQAANILPASAVDDLFGQYAEIWKVYPRGEDELVASHNDLKPQNMIYDGERLWLIDWEAAFLNDRYVDLAVVANFFVRDEAQEKAYLECYFGAPTSEVQQARFYLMSILLHLFYAALLLVMASRSGIAVDPDRAVPDFRDFHQRLITGEIDLTGSDDRVDYALVHLNAMRRKLQAQRFNESMAVIGGLRAGA
jgi:thiamine kinase-like enzyme